MKTKTILALFMIFILLLCGCQNDYNNEEITYSDTLTFTYTFENSRDGWMGGLDDSSNNHHNKGIYLNCGLENMYTTKKISSKEGLLPLTSYKVNMTFDISSTLSSNNTIPLNKIVVNAGVVNVQPDIELIQKGNNKYFFISPNNEFDDPNTKLISLGNIDITDKSTNNRNASKNFEQTFNAFTNSNGDLWIIIGVDSDYEGTDTLFLDNINVNIERENATFS
ncbi:hypothetical protein SH1V18_37330 [Vallitalea longa]|uniref:Uncharacterized protein n=1 Tax=Vallitalea longa TaxID=2936439 RepID=A0A9W5YFB2_9FIRM|nr:hypothetical protein [Vallitalea longa]GKX31253.1 hypothetical protein SH1V18_37330 [Vallitalea longa]